MLSARNGRDALKQAADYSEQIDLITDLVMPDMGGREVAERLPAFHPETKVLYMSGYVENIGELLGKEYAFIEKPFSPEDMPRKIQQVLEGNTGRQTSA